ncbi:hypothetical protein F2Q69_00036015 [Brassica cretica]|uniref:Uncharacterized protein n=1 Tax=Brassica cretica TaxID=69181 RepID=A0A8S9SRQ1_BRACR|nr:hypothetical protein F2Q69_00036015 [Brassica cretica]
MNDDIWPGPGLRQDDLREETTEKQKGQLKRKDDGLRRRHALTRRPSAGAKSGSTFSLNFSLRKQKESKVRDIDRPKNTFTEFYSYYKNEERYNMYIIDHQ